MKATLVPLVLCFLVALPSSSEDSREQTIGYLNGRWWTSRSMPEKLGFVIGYTEHHLVASDYLAAQQEADPTCKKNAPNYSENWFRAPHTNGEVVESLNDFYREPANAPMPIAAAWDITTLKFNGGSSKEVQETTDYLRSRAIDALSQTDRVK